MRTDRTDPGDGVAMTEQICAHGACSHSLALSLDQFGQSRDIEPPPVDRMDGLACAAGDTCRLQHSAEKAPANGTGRQAEATHRSSPPCHPTVVRLWDTQIHVSLE